LHEATQSNQSPKRQNYPNLVTLTISEDVEHFLLAFGEKSYNGILSQRFVCKLKTSSVESGDEHKKDKKPNCEDDSDDL
jgi:hypothetical protein